ncbi:MAG TPA: sugar phosphate nucleotidyltransferase [Bryobacteraceae bacterium]|jgi:NDP-sugar pyrophosphorylase family protein
MRKALNTSLMSAKGLIMAGGSSERMRASGTITHKALREVAGRTLLQHNVEMLRSHGVHDITVAVNEAEHDLLAAASRFHLLIEPKPLGTIGAARLAPPAETLIVLYVDNLTDLDLRAFVDFHRGSGAALTVASHDEPFRIPFGQLELAGSWVVAYKEKPLLPISISSGLYVLSPRAIDAIQPGERIHAPELINRLIANGEKVAAFRHQAWWIDINDEAALACAEAALGREVAR